MYNKTTIVGRLTKKPELKYTQSNTAYAKFDVAVGRSYKSASGEYETDFFSCIAWKRTAENIVSNLDKGSLVLVEGNIEFGHYLNKDNVKIYTTTLQAHTVKYLEPKKDRERPQSQDTHEDMYPAKGVREYNERQGQGTPVIDVTEDDLPF